jgi:pimeloyl-ACP methyl ester carboxylesterase
LVGAPSAARPDVLADTSPAELSIRAPVAVVNGEQDGIAPPSMARAFVAKMARRGMHFDQIVLPDTGHVELIAPGTRAWTSAVAETKRLLGISASAQDASAPRRRR